MKARRLTPLGRRFVVAAIVAAFVLAAFIVVMVPSRFGPGAG